MRHITTKSWTNQQPHTNIIIGKAIDTNQKEIIVAKTAPIGCLTIKSRYEK